MKKATMSDKSEITAGDKVLVDVGHANGGYEAEVVQVYGRYFARIKYEGEEWDIMKNRLKKKPIENKDYTPTGDDCCPICNYKNNGASTMVGENVKPNPHDVSICLSCGEWLEYADDMKLIILTEKTRKELEKEQLDMLRDAGDYIKKRGLIKRK